ncbi:hypothetical protein A3Q56_04547 [Intoshia linei]|uniref:Dynein heavy chain C-terminal domain-containing protein n=1 Tax=Intoshia linei TaxID=1819745 RepID=A0A177B0R7_9BILA|nr:hypothetical protein A3Q56_04547 [Intoshia linei]
MHEFTLYWCKKYTNIVEKLIRGEIVDTLNYSHFLPSNIWFPSILHPRKFLFTIIQQYAREENYSIVDINIDFQILEKTTKIDESIHHIFINKEKNLGFLSHSYFIFGLKLLNASWNIENDRLCKTTHSQFQYFPDIMIKPHFVQRETIIKDNISIYNCPLFKSMPKYIKIKKNEIYNDYICTIPLPYSTDNNNTNYWSMMDVKLLT